MSRYYYPVPNGPIYGASLKIENMGDTDVTGIYADSGIFVSYDDGSGVMVPIATCGDRGLIEIPAHSTVYIDSKLPQPMQVQRQCRIVIDSTSLPSDCLLSASLLVGTAKVGNPNVQNVRFKRLVLWAERKSTRTEKQETVQACGLGMRRSCL